MGKVKKVCTCVHIIIVIIWFIFAFLFILFGITFILTIVLLGVFGDSDNETLKSKRGAVASDSPICSNIGVEILEKDGSAVDSAIATLFCIGVHNLQLAGIGGGGFLMYYNASMEQAFAIDFREKAPQEIPESVMQMFKNNSNSTKRGTLRVYFLNAFSYTIGGLSIGVPGQVKGLYEAHQQFGRLPWSELIQPSIVLAENGVKILANVAKSIEKTVSSNLLSGNFANLKSVSVV